ncbi:hypothetical protein STEG23_011288 [Scotinomys teguina]
MEFAGKWMELENVILSEFVPPLQEIELSTYRASPEIDLSESPSQTPYEVRSPNDSKYSQVDTEDMFNPVKL